jgi:hypothetical protein
MLTYECSVRHVFCKCKLCLNTDLVGGTNTINICLILSTIYIFTPACGCVGRGPCALLFPGVYNTVKMALVVYSKLVPIDFYTA